MQIYAFDKKRNLISSKEAIRHQDYFCLECQAIVRLRGGRWRQDHFYHFNPSLRSCSSGKSLFHLHTQYTLQKRLAPEEIWLEKRFPEIGRVADVVWPSKQLIFEVQCSPISAKEVEARNRDYKQMGYLVVWILHDRRFNRYKITPAEAYLRPHPHYFTNVAGIFYDQYSFIRGGRRIKRTARFPIHIQHVTMQISRQLPLERQKWPLAFRGDLSYQKVSLSPRRKKKRPFLWSRFVTYPFRFIFRLLLEKATK